MRDNLTCKLCKRLSLKLYQCLEDQKLLCESCFELHQSYKNQDKICSKCQNINSEDEVEPDRIVRNYLSQLEFECKFNCGSKITYFDYKDHYLNKCPSINNMTLPQILENASQEELCNFNEERLKFLMENEKCCICYELLWHPYSCSSCHQSFCFKCIKKATELSDDDPSCPCCKASLRVEKNRAILNSLSLLKFRCRNGCGQLIGYYDLEEHYVKDCPRIGKDRDDFDRIHLKKLNNKEFSPQKLE